MLGGPGLNLFRRAFRVAVVVVVVPVVLVEPALVLALQLVVEHDALDVGAALAETLLGLLVGAVDLQVVLAFARADEAGVEGLVTLWMRVPVALQQAVSGLRQSYRVVAVARLAGRLDQALLAEMAKVA